MTVQSLYRSFLNALATIYSRSEATNICDLLFEYKAGIKRSAMLANPIKPVEALTEIRLLDCLRELMNYKPIQYITGIAWFYKMEFKVNENVLIPRPETEELTSRLVHFLKTNPGKNVIDIGTGSGCIAIALKKNVPQISMTAIDISQDALALAIENAANQKITINFIQLDFLDEHQWDNLTAVDVIVSNPPYIPEGSKERLDKNVVDFEPHLALFVETATPLVFYEKIAAFGRKKLSLAGRIFLEVHEDFAIQTAALFNDDYYDAQVVKDLNGNNRMLLVTRRCL